MRLGPEWRGKLPPGAQVQLDRTLAGWRDSGLVTHVEVLCDPECEAAAKYEGVLFPLDAPPQLPFAGCERSPCCACDYISVLDDEGGVDAKPGQVTSLGQLASKK